MPPVRLAHGVLAAASEEAWLAWPSGQPVAGAPRGSAAPLPGAPVALGPRTSRPGAVVAALVQLDELLRGAGPAACGAGVDLGGGFRSGRLDGAVEERRDAVLAALRWLGPDRAHRLGDRAAVLTALCGARATRRVGAALHNAAHDRRWAAIHLAVAASDVLEPEQLEHVLTLPEPPGVEPIPGGLPSALAVALTEVLGPYPRARRLALLLDLWDTVLACPDRPRPAIRLMEGQFGEERVAEVLSVRRGVRDAWVLDHLADHNGPLAWGVRAPWPERAGTAMWTSSLFDENHVPTAPTGRRFVSEESKRLLVDALAAVTLTTIAIAADRRPPTEVLAEHARALAMSVNPEALPAGDADLDSVLAGPLPTPGRPGHLAARLAVAAVGLTAWDFRREFNMYWWAVSHRGARYGPPTTGLFTDCAGIFHPDDPERDVARFARPLIAQAYAQGRAVLTELIERFQDDHALPDGQIAERWARACGWTPDTAGPGRRRPPYATCDCNGWWVLALADNLAALEQRPRLAPNWRGGELPWARLAGEPVEVDPDAPAPPTSVPGAVAVAAQFLRWGARAPSKPGSWTELTEDLRGQVMQVGAPFQVPEEIDVWHGQELPSTELRIQVAHHHGDLNEWAAYMGNCIAGYSEEGESGTCVLLALRKPDRTIVANVDVHLGRSRWGAHEARARFNEDLDPELDAALNTWLDSLPPTRTMPGAETVEESDPVRVIRAPRSDRRAGPARRLRPAPAVLTARQQLADAVEAQRAACLAQHGDVLVAVASRVAAHPPDDAEAAVIVLARATPSRICEAVADTLAGTGLPALWNATAPRPVGAGLATLDPTVAGLLGAESLAGPGPVPPNLRAVANLDPVKRARRLESGQRAVRAAVGTLLRTADPRLEAAIADNPRPAPLCTAVIALAAWPTVALTARPTVRIQLGDGAAVPAHPAGSLLDDTGPWAQAWLDAVELDPVALPAAVAALRTRAEHGALTSIGVPDAWLSGRRWSALWSRAHRRG